MARLFEEAGLDRLHLVDLDGAKASGVVNWAVLETICKHTRLSVDFGGGVKTDEDMRRVFEAGADYACVGSIAQTNPEQTAEWLEKYGKDKKVGDKITLNTEQLSGEYTISGILDMRTSGETFPFLISWEKLENYENYNESSNMVYVHVKEKNAEDIKKYCNEIAEKNNLPVAFNNQYFRYVNQVISADQLGILGILIGLVFIGSYTVIKSIFQISIINKIQNYGRLRTIGTTQKQIKKIVKKEGRYLGVRGILTGISLAILCSAIILAKGINIRNYIVCAMITAVVCCIIVSISINKPCLLYTSPSPRDA